MECVLLWGRMHHPFFILHGRMSRQWGHLRVSFLLQPCLGSEGSGVLPYGYGKLGSTLTLGLAAFQNGFVEAGMEVIR